MRGKKLGKIIFLWNKIEFLWSFISKFSTYHLKCHDDDDDYEKLNELIEKINKNFLLLFHGQ